MIATDKQDDKDILDKDSMFHDKSESVFKDNLKKTSKKKVTKKTESKPTLKQNSGVDTFLRAARQANSSISDRVLVNKFCIEQNKKVLLPGDWSVCYKYQLSGDIKDLLEYIHNNIRSRP